MNTPNADLPEPIITKPLQFKIVKKNKKKECKQYLDKILDPAFLKTYFKKNISKKNKN